MYTIATKAQTQITKDFRTEESKVQGLENSTTQYSNNSKCIGSARKEKKKDHRKQDQEQRAESFTPISGVNTVNTSSRGGRNQNTDWPKKDLSQMTC